MNRRVYYFVTLLFVILSAKASFFDLTNACWIGIDLILFWVGFQNGRLYRSDFELFGKFALVVIAFFALRSFFLLQLPISFFLSDVVFVFKYIFTSFLFCAVLRGEAIPYLIKVMVHLSILSLPLFCLQVIAGDAVYAFGKMLNFPNAHFDGYVNMLVFTYVKVHHYRNAGFSWEPGAFGFFLLLTLLLQLITNNFEFDKRSKWLMLAILTTFSTTTYVAFAFLLLLYFRGRGVRYVKLAVFTGPLLVLSATMLPFIFDKIVATYNSDMEDMKNLHTLSQWYVEHGMTMPLNRFASMLCTIEMFGYHLIWGISNIYQETIPVLQHVSLSNGIFSLIAQFGVIGVCFLMYRFYLLVKGYTGRAELGLYSVLIILICGFGECIYVSSIVLCFLFFYRYATVYKDSENEPPAFNMNRKQLLTQYK